MTENNLASLVRGVCHDVGRMKGIEFHLPATWGMQAPGRWEAGYKLRRQGHSTVILTYWFSVDMLLREEVILPWEFPPTLEQCENFRNDIIAKVDQMLLTAPDFVGGAFKSLRINGASGSHTPGPPAKSFIFSGGFQPPTKSGAVRDVEMAMITPALSHSLHTPRQPV